MRKILSIRKILLLLAMMCLLSVPAFAGTKKLNVKVAVKATSIYRNLELETSTQLVVKDGKNKINPSKVKFKSSKPSVVTVNKKGLLTTKTTGTSIITITYGKKKCKLTVSVVRPTPTPTPTNNSLSVLVSGNAGYAYVGSEELLNKAVLKGYTTSDIEWKIIEGSSSLVELRTSGESLYGTPKALGTVTIGLYLKGDSKCYGQFSYTFRNPAGGNIPSKEITVEGVTFNLKDVNDSYVLNESYYLGEGTFTIYADRIIDSNDITVKINGTNIENFENSGIPESFNLKEYIYPNWENRKTIFHVNKNIKKDNKSGIFVDVYSLYSAGNADISIYYKNKLVKSVQITLVPIPGAVREKNELNYIEQNALRDLPQNATLIEKFIAIQNFIGHTYSYSEMNCLDGASYLRLIAMDLGYYSRLAFDGIEERNYYMRGGFCDIVHTWMEIYIPETNEWRRHSVQGHY